MATHDPVRVISKIRNNRLLVLWEDSGLRLPEFVAQLGISLESWYKLVSLKRYPTVEMARRISEATGLGAEELFPGYLKHVARSVASRTIPEARMLAIAAAADKMLPAVQEEEIFQAERKSEIDAIMQERLNPRERKVLRLRYGMEDETEHTLEEIGREFGICRARVAQIEAKALRKLSEPTRDGYHLRLNELFEGMG